MIYDENIPYKPILCKPRATVDGRPYVALCNLHVYASALVVVYPS